MADYTNDEIDPHNLTDDQSDEVTRIVEAEVEAHIAIKQWRRLLHADPADLLSRLIALGWRHSSDDRGMAERRITDRKTLIETIARALRPDAFWNETADYPTSTREEWEAEQAVARMEAEPVADAILALPSTPITSTREITAVARNIVNQIGDEWIPCGKGICAGRDGHAGGCAEESGWDDEDEPAPVDRLSVIREVMAYMDQVEAPRVAIKIGQHFGVAPVEEEA